MVRVTINFFATYLCRQSTFVFEIQHYLFIFNLAKSGAFFELSGLIKQDHTISRVIVKQDHPILRIIVKFHQILSEINDSKLLSTPPPSQQVQ